MAEDPVEEAQQDVAEPEVAEEEVQAPVVEEAVAPEPDLDTSWLREPVFNRHKHFGESSDPFSPKRYLQDGHWFTAKGVYVKE